MRDDGGSSGPVNLPDEAVLTRHDHVEAKCAHMVERNPGVVISAARERQPKRRDSSGVPRDLKDLIALCDENVARSERRRRGRRRLDWSYGHVFFSADTRPPRDRRQGQGIPEAVELIDVLVAVLARDHISLRSGHAYGTGEINGKGTWIGGWPIG